MDRRDFLKGSLAGIGASYLLGGMGVAIPMRASAANLSFNITAQGILKQVLASSPMLTWQYMDANPFNAGRLGTSLVVNEGDVVTINLLNNIPNYPVSITVPGLLDSAQTTLPGAIQSYQFVAAKAGSYLIQDSNPGLIGKAMGLSAPLVVLPADGSQALTPGEVEVNAYDKAYTLFLHELDSRLSAAVASGLPFDMNMYKPDYFFVNGLSYPETVYDPLGNIDDSKVILMNANETVAIRFINGGLIFYPMHFHGYHVDVINRNRNIEQHVISKDTVLVKTNECVDTLLSVGDQIGLYPLHTHYIPGVTSAGYYPGGGMLMMKAV